ncbi:exodeoxyribonuclease III [Sphingomonas sp. MMS24-JH45]
MWHGQKGFNGVAVLARGADPVERQRGLAGEDEDAHSRYLECDVGGLVVASIDLPNGNPQPGPKFDYKLRWIDRLRDRAAALLAEEVPTILAGDYNVIPNDDDTYSVRAMAQDALMQPESRQGYRRLLAQGWTDALRTCQPVGAAYGPSGTYQAGAWQRDAGFRIDHLLLSPAVADRLQEAGVDKEYRGREKASDHAPTWVRLRCRVGPPAAATLLLAASPAAAQEAPRFLSQPAEPGQFDLYGRCRTRAGGGVRARLGSATSRAASGPTHCCSATPRCGRGSASGPRYSSADRWRGCAPARRTIRSIPSRASATYASGCGRMCAIPTATASRRAGRIRRRFPPARAASGAATGARARYCR